MITFKPKYMKKGKPAQIVLDEVFETAKNHSKTHMLVYEILKEGKNEYLLQLKMSN
jgi:hypothetical protein